MDCISTFFCPKMYLSELRSSPAQSPHHNPDYITYSDHSELPIPVAFSYMPFLDCACLMFLLPHLITHLQGGCYLSLVLLSLSTLLSFGTIMVDLEMSFGYAYLLMLYRNITSLYILHSQWSFIFFLSWKPIGEFPNTLLFQNKWKIQIS